MKTFSIKSSDTDTLIEFSERSEDQFMASYSRLATSVTTQVSDYTDSGGLAKFFERLSTSELPSTKEYQWKSLEGEFCITGACNKLGHVTLEIELIAFQGNPEQWRFTGNLMTDYGLLPEIARNAKQFFEEG